MNAIDLFKARYLDLHERVLLSVTEGLQEHQFRERILEDLNPIGWILWHIGRAEDVGINRLVVDGSQVLDETWHQRLGLREPGAGTGMTSAQADSLSSQIDVEGLWGYLKAVHARTLSVLEGLDPETLSEVPSNNYVESVMVGEGVLLPPAHGFLPLYMGKPRGWFLAHLALAHSYYHVGQIGIAKRLWRLRA